MGIDPAALLAGPRGRRLCLEVATRWSAVGRSEPYWQEPDGRDRLAAEPELTAALRRTAEAIAHAEGARWWATGCEDGDTTFWLTDGAVRETGERSDCWMDDSREWRRR